MAASTGWAKAPTIHPIDLQIALGNIPVALTALQSQTTHASPQTGAARASQIATAALEGAVANTNLSPKCIFSETPTPYQSVESASRLAPSSASNESDNEDSSSYITPLPRASGATEVNKLIASAAMSLPGQAASSTTT